LKTCLAMEKGVAVPNIKTGGGVEGGMLFRQKETYNIFSLITFLLKKFENFPGGSFVIPNMMA
jgi:hypothetical protein